jgi:hypothetical protein
LALRLTALTGFLIILLRLLSRKMLGYHLKIGYGYIMQGCIICEYAVEKILIKLSVKHYKEQESFGM